MFYINCISELNADVVLKITTNLICLQYRVCIWISYEFIIYLNLLKILQFIINKLYLLELLKIMSVMSGYDGVKNYLSSSSCYEIYVPYIYISFIQCEGLFTADDADVIIFMLMLMR